MRAWRSDSRARTASSLRTPRHFLIGLLAFLFAGALGLGPVPESSAAPARAARTPAKTDTTDDSGFRVRVSETKSGQKAPALPAKPDAVDAPDVPTPPDVPEPPDVGNEDNGENDLVRFGEDITIAADKVVEGNVVAIGGDVTVYGRVKGDVTSVGGRVETKGAGVIEGDAVSLGGGVNSTDSSSIAGSNVSIGNRRFWHGWGMMPMMGLMRPAAVGEWFVRTIVGLALALFFAWLALLIWRNGLLRASDVLRERFGKSFLWGLLTMAALVVAIPVGIISLVLLAAIAIVILCITIIGIPVAVLLVIALVLGIIGIVVGAIFAGFMGYVNGVFYLGRRILGERGRTTSPLAAIAVGMALILALKVAGHIAGFGGFMLFHPLSVAFGVAAGFLTFILTVAGLGALWISFMQGGGISWRSYNWGPLRRGPAPEAPPASAPAAAPAATAPPAAEAPRPVDGTSDAP